MSDKKRTPFLDAPIKPSRKHPQGLSRTGSDGTLKSTTVVTPTVFPSVRNERSPPPKRNSSSPTLKTMACNGSHSPVNGASGIHTRDTGSRKMPMFPPTHCRAGKSDSSDSGASSTSSGLAFRSGEATVQVNRDDRLSDQSSCSASPARDQISPSTGEFSTQHLVDTHKGCLHAMYMYMCMCIANDAGKETFLCALWHSVYTHTRATL